jgi:hypothetical protein
VHPAVQALIAWLCKVTMAIRKFLVKLVEVRIPKVRYAFVPKPFKSRTVPVFLPHGRTCYSAG